MCMGPGGIAGRGDRHEESSCCMEGCGVSCGVTWRGQCSVRDVGRRVLGGILFASLQGASAAAPAAGAGVVVGSGGCAGCGVVTSQAGHVNKRALGGATYLSTEPASWYVTHSPMSPSSSSPSPSPSSLAALAVYVSTICTPDECELHPPTASLQHSEDCRRGDASQSIRGGSSLGAEAFASF